MQLTHSELAREALAELDAPEMNVSPVELMGGTLDWETNWVGQLEAERDPVNAPTLRPHVVAPCQALQKHPALRLRCRCGRGLDFLALASFATGVLVVSSPRRLPPRLREGGPNDLASVKESDPPTRRWSFMPWEALMLQRQAKHRSAWDATKEHPFLGPDTRVIGDAAKRQIFECERCGAVHLFRNVTLLRMMLEAIAAGSRIVQINQQAA